MALPPGRAKLSTKPAPTGSVTFANTIGTVRVACNSAPVVYGRGQNDVRPERDKFRRVLRTSLDIASAPADVDPHVTAHDPAQLLYRLLKPREAGLSFRIVAPTKP